MITYNKGLKLDIKKHLAKVNRLINANIDVDLTLLTKANQHALSNKGKQIRPCLLLLTAANFGKINKNCIIAAAAIEMIHIASLVHDDVVDDSDIRRNKKSLKTLWGSKVAVLAGDYLVANSFLQLTKLQNNQILQITSKCATQMSKGELMQLGFNFENFNVKDYYQIVDWKTSSLISISMQIGAVINGAKSKDIKIIEKAAKKIGLAFQIIDDVLDYDLGNKTTGKPFGQDLKQKKITLPVALLIKNADKKDILKFRKIISSKDIDKTQLNEIYELMLKYECFKAARKIAQKNAQEAKKTIQKITIKNGVDDLLSFANYLVSRKN